MEITMSPQTIWANDVYFGKRKHDNYQVTLLAPSWNCDWYWSFGNMITKNEFYHLDDWETPHWYEKKQNRNMYDALKEDYFLAENIEKNLWKFCEFTETINSLKNIAQVFHRGGSNYTYDTNVKELVKSEEQWRKINFVIIPQLLDKLYTIIAE